jgi:CheY-like chemotaxis protein
MAKILVVDDDTDFADILRTMLEKEGLHVNTARNSEQALASAREDRPDVILLDIIMSHVLDGFRASRELRADAKLKDIPILVISSLTGVHGVGAFQEVEGPDIDGWLSKPVQPTDLIRKIDAVLAKHRSRR